MFGTTSAHVDIDTGEGTMGTFVVHPDQGGPHPMVLFLMDAPGKRPLLHSMASRLAGHGYYVMLANLYYRTTAGFELDFASAESFARMRDLMGALGNRMVARDASALFAHAESDPAAHAADAGCVGYCMSGPFALYVAAEHDDYVPLEMVDRFEAAMADAGTRGRVERYWGNHHGFAFDDRPAYDPVADARHWEVLLDLFGRSLAGPAGDAAGGSR